MPAASRTLAADAEQRGWGEEAAPTAPLVQQLELLAAGEEITSTPSPPAPTAGGPPSTAAPRRALVEEHRLRGREALTLTGLAVKIDQLRTSLHALAAKARRHEETIRRLERRTHPDQDYPPEDYLPHRFGTSSLLGADSRGDRDRRKNVWSRIAFVSLSTLVVLAGCGGHDSTAFHDNESGLTSSSLPTPPAHPTPPANAIVFAKSASDSLDARIEIAYVPAAGGNVLSLTAAQKEGMVAAEPRWSPDGSRIAFVMSPRGHLTRYAGDGDIQVMRADGTDIRRLTDGLGASSPAWSPDGSRIAFVMNEGQELVVMRADGSDQHAIARARGYYQWPAWSPDGRTIAYQSSPNRNIDVTAIFTIRTDGTHERQLTTASVSAGFPAWSPDGSLIAYAARDQLWIMNSDGSDPHRLTNCRLPCVDDFAPAWSPDASALVFVQQENGGAARRLYILDVATHEVRPLTPGIRWVGWPDWRPPPG